MSAGNPGFAAMEPGSTRLSPTSTRVVSRPPAQRWQDSKEQAELARNTTQAWGLSPPPTPCLFLSCGMKCNELEGHTHEDSLALWSSDNLCEFILQQS